MRGAWRGLPSSKPPPKSLWWTSRRFHMKDVLPSIEQWRARGERVAVATVVKTLGSAPRGVGAKMAVSSDGSMAGSVSGGCIEGAVFDACQEALKTGQARL